MKKEINGNAGKPVSRVLVADEDADFLASLTVALRSEGDEVYAAGNTEEVLNILYNSKFDLLMLGLGLGPQNGVEVAEWAKLTYPDLPVVFMAESSYLVADGRINRVSPYPVLAKPFDLRSLDEILYMKPSEN
jgi:DNA-binding response OmpR family regulator